MQHAAVLTLVLCRRTWCCYRARALVCRRRLPWHPNGRHRVRRRCCLDLYVHQGVEYLRFAIIVALNERVARVLLAPLVWAPRVVLLVSGQLPVIE